MPRSIEEALRDRISETLSPHISVMRDEHDWAVESLVEHMIDFFNLHPDDRKAPYLNGAFVIAVPVKE